MEDELNAVFESLFYGGTPLSSTYLGRMFRFPKGARVGLRSDSFSCGPTVDVFGPSNQRIEIRFP